MINVASFKISVNPSLPVVSRTLSIDIFSSNEPLCFSSMHACMLVMYLFCFSMLMGLMKICFNLTHNVALIKFLNSIFFYKTKFLGQAVKVIALCMSLNPIILLHSMLLKIMQTLASSSVLI